MMKGHTRFFILVTILQVVFIAVLIFLFEEVGNSNNQLRFTMQIPDQFIEDDDNVKGDLYVQYDQGILSKDFIPNSNKPTSGDRIYILLAEDEQGIAEVKQISKERIQTKDSDSIVIRGFYDYEDPYHSHYISYGLEHIQQIERFGTFKKDDKVIVTINIGPLGQRTIVHIEKDPIYKE